MYTDENGVIVIYVSDMCAYAWREGDIDLRIGGRSKRMRSGDTPADSQIMMDGNSAHNLLETQAHMGDFDAGQYTAEVPLSINTVVDGRKCRVEGRADGVYFDGAYYTVEEIKSSPRNPTYAVKEPQSAHIAQAAVYAYMLALQNGVTAGVNVRMKYVSTLTGESEMSTRAYSVAELEEIFTATVSAYGFIINYTAGAYAEGMRDIVAAKFPYEKIRGGQREFMLEVMRIIREKRRLIAGAPTGTGKTMATVYPALKSVAAGRGSKAFYLTAKNLTGKAAEDAIGLIRDKLPERGRFLICTVVTSRSKCCIRDAKNARDEDKPAVDDAESKMSEREFDMLVRDAITRSRQHFGGINETQPPSYAQNDEGRQREKSAYAEFYAGQYCNPADCPYAGAHYSRVNEAVEDILRHEVVLDAETAMKYARKYRVCPYEMTLDASMYAPFVICDLNYLFDPRVRLRRYFGADAEDGDYIFLIDEAHNLPDRARDMYSMKLDSSQLRALSAKLGTSNVMLMAAAASLAERVESYGSLCKETEETGEDGAKTGYAVENDVPPGLENAVSAFITKCDEAFRAGMDPRPVADVYFDMRKLTELLSCFGKNYRSVYEKNGDCVSAKLMCLDPAPLLDAAMKKGRSAVLFSATMTPLDYFRDILGCYGCGDTVEVPSPFERDNLCLIAHRATNVRYSARDENAAPVAALIHSMAAAKAGNYIAFMPSYSYLEKVTAAYRTAYPNEKLVVQARGMGERQKREFLAAFDNASDGTAKNAPKLGFCVLGGMFSEGIDLRGDRLIGVAVVGVGMPLITFERGIIARYFEETREDGFAYAYVYPGITKVLQAAGRVIRTSSDRGVVLLIDDRYATPEYGRLYPDTWRDIFLSDSVRDVERILYKFWNK